MRSAGVVFLLLLLLARGCGGGLLPAGRNRGAGSEASDAAGTAGATKAAAGWKRAAFGADGSVSVAVGAVGAVGAVEAGAAAAAATGSTGSGVGARDGKGKGGGLKSSRDCRILRWTSSSTAYKV